MSRSLPSWHLVLLLGVLLCTTPGCAWLRNAVGPEDDPAASSDDSGADDTTDAAGLAPAEPDTTVEEPQPVEAERPAPQRPVPIEPEPTPEDDAPDEDPAPLESTSPAEEMTSAPADSQLVDPDPPLRIRISDGERDELLGRIDADLQIARETLAQEPVLDELDTEARQAWETLAHYEQRAVAFLDADDLRSAADLAVKARLLALELRPR